MSTTKRRALDHVPGRDDTVTADQLTAAARSLALSWTAGEEIDGAPALVRLGRVSRTLRRLVPDVTPEIVAGALLYAAAEFAPETEDVPAALRDLSPEVAYIVTCLDDEEVALAAGRNPFAALPRDARWLIASAGRKIVDLQSLLSCCGENRDPAAFWVGFLDVLRYNRSFCDQARDQLPDPLLGELSFLVEEACRIARPALAEARHTGASRAGLQRR